MHFYKDQRAALYFTISDIVQTLINNTQKITEIKNLKDKVIFFLNYCPKSNRNAASSTCKPAGKEPVGCPTCTTGPTISKRRSIVSLQHNDKYFQRIYRTSCSSATINANGWPIGLWDCHVRLYKCVFIATIFASVQICLVATPLLQQQYRQFLSDWPNTYRVLYLHT